MNTRLSLQPTKALSKLASRVLLLIMAASLLLIACDKNAAGGGGRRPCEDDTDCDLGQFCDTDDFCSDATDIIPTGDPAITAFPDPVQFGFAPLRSDTIREVTIGNTGSDTLIVTSLVVVEEDYQDEYRSLPAGDVSIEIAPNENTVVQVILAPVDDELDFGSLEIHSNDPANPVISVALESEWKGNPTLGLCALDESAPNPQAFVDCTVDGNGLPLSDFGLVPFGSTNVKLVAIRNEAVGNAPLVLDDATVLADASPIADEFSVRLFTYDTDGVTELPVTFPTWLRAADVGAGIEADIVWAEITFNVALPGVVTNTWLEVSTNDPGSDDVRIIAEVDGCPPNYWDANNDPLDGCEYFCVYSGDETCGTGVDDNCDGNIEEAGAIGCVDYYLDTDGDSFGVPGNLLCLCNPSPSDFYTALDASDCNDSNDTAFPGANEICDGIDNNCDGNADEGQGQTTCGLGVCTHTVDNCVGGLPQACDAYDGSSIETCDGTDNDCNGTTDDGLGQTTCGVGVCDHTVDNCQGGVLVGCNPFEGSGPELCNGLDDNCNGAVDADVRGETDTDGDNWLSCEECDDDDPNNYPGNNEMCDGFDNDCNGAADAIGGEGDADNDGDLDCSDCEPNNPNNFNGNTEICDGFDNDCNGVADASGFEIDFDNDGILSCEDCNDNDPLNVPGGVEVCDGIDNDCNGVADFPGEQIDGDNDGSLSCADCDDGDPNNFPGNLEVCDGQDNDCGGTADFPGEQVDGDNDLALSCNDCDDGDPNNFPGNPEICDGQDNDCSGTADFPGGEGDSDNDNDPECSDCDDSDPNNYNGNTEICDGQDNNCNGIFDQAEVPVSVMCADVANATEDCSGAAGCIVAACSANWYNVNTTYADGCECQAAPTPVATGGTCSTAINLGTFTDTNMTTQIVSGNTPLAGRSVWYRFNAADANPTAADTFHVDGRFTNNPGTAYVIDVYRGGCPVPGTGVTLATAENSSFSWFTDFASTSSGCGGVAPCGEGNCTAGNTLGVNICNDDTADFYVRIYQVLGQAECAQYQFAISNGVY